MIDLDAILKPIQDCDPRRTAVEVHRTLQNLILDGRLPSGTILSQVKVAKAFNVSRTPVREAMRMLQEGDLLTGDPNQQFRVVGINPADIEALYIKRLVLETLGVAMTTRRMTAELKLELGAVIEALESELAHQNFDTWLALHRQLHRLIVHEGGDALVQDLGQLEIRSERYQSSFKGAHLPGWWQRGEAEHRALFDTMCSGDVQKASELAARHLTRTALELLAALAPDYDTSRLRASLSFAVAGALAA